jgi:hypothetical protein
MAPLFAKAVPKAGKENQMRDSDKRKFRESIAKSYRDLGSDQLDELLPKNVPVLLTKLHPKVRYKNQSP